MTGSRLRAQRTAPPPDVAAELAAIRADLTAIRALLESRRHRSGPEIAALLVAIHEHAEGRAFTAAELVEHASLREATALRTAIVATPAGLNARRLGKLLKRIDGANVGGLTVFRVGDDRTGAVWKVRVSRVSNSPNSWTSPIR